MPKSKKRTVIKEASRSAQPRKKTKEAVEEAEVRKPQVEKDEKEVALIKPEKSEEDYVDLRDAKYKGFVVPAEPSKQPGWPMCIVGDMEEAFPFRALPLEKKPSFDDLMFWCNGRFESVATCALLKKSKYKIIYVDEEGRCKRLPYNPDATAFSRSGMSSPLVGDAVFSK